MRQNSYCSCSFSQTNLFSRYWAMPGFYLKKMVMENFNTKEVDPDIADSIDFMVENVSNSNSLFRRYQPQ